MEEKIDYSQVERRFELFLGKREDQDYFRQVAGSDAVKKSHLRWHFWQICLGYFKDLTETKDYLALAKKKREVYEKKKKAMLEVFDSYEDPLLHNPLMKVQEESFEKATENIVDKDLERTFQEVALFKEEATLKSLKNVLLTWCMDNKALGYRQGMNELVGVIFMVHHDQCQKVKMMQNASDEYKEFMSDKYAEHDVYALYDLLLYTGLESFYAHEEMFKKNKKGSKEMPTGRIYGFLADDYNVESTHF